MAFMNGREICGEMFNAPVAGLKDAKFAAAERKLFIGGGKVVEIERRARA
jgi:hypothetical protein